MFFSTATTIIVSSSVLLTIGVCLVAVAVKANADIPSCISMPSLRISPPLLKTEDATLFLEEPRLPSSLYILLAAIAALLLVYRIILEQLHARAYDAAVERMKRDDVTKDRPPLYDSTHDGWTLTGISPATWGLENCFHSLIHVPAYVYRYIRTLIYIIPRDAFRRYVLRMKVTDEQLYDFVCNSMLILLCDTDETGDILTYRAESTGREIFITDNEHANCPIDGSTLTIVFDKGVIVKAETADGPVTALKWLTKNEVLADALAITMSLWTHTQIHVAGERCAAQIARLEVEQLKPCALHTFSIHDALLNSPISVIGDGHPFVGWPNRIQTAIWNLHNQIPHDLTRIKNPKKFSFFNYFLAAHAVTARVLRKHNLAHVINVDDFFALVVMHDADHACAFKHFWDTLPLRPSNNDSWDGYFKSMYRNCVHQQIWVAPNTNPFWSMYIKDSGNPILQDLYQGLRKIDVEMADWARYCISF